MVDLVDGHHNLRQRYPIVSLYFQSISLRVMAHLPPSLPDHQRHLEVLDCFLGVLWFPFIQLALQRASRLFLEEFLLPPKFIWRTQEGELPFNMNRVVIIVAVIVPRVFLDVLQCVGLYFLPLLLSKMKISHSAVVRCSRGLLRIEEVFFMILEASRKGRMNAFGCPADCS